VVIELEELEDHGLVAPNLVPDQRDLALEWLSERSGKASEELRQVILPENWSRRNENPRIRRLKPKRTRQKVAADVRINPGVVSFRPACVSFCPNSQHTHRRSSNDAL
jgi:hypothetical protein